MSWQLTTNDFNSGLYIRGSNRDQNIILLDGMPVSNPYHLFGIFSSFDQEALQFVRVQKNTTGIEYGNRLGAVIEMNLKDGSRKRHQGFGHLSLLSTRTRVEGPFKWGSYMVSLRRMLAGLLTRSMPLPKDLIIPYDFYDAMGKIILKPNIRQRLEFTSYLSSDVYDFNVVDQNPASGQYKWGNRVFGLSYTGLISSSLTIKAHASRSHFKARYLPRDLLRHERMNTKFTQNTARLWLVWATPFSSKLSLGGDTQHFSSFLTMRGFSFSEIGVPQNNSEEHAVFARWNQSWGKVAQLELGNRFTYFALWKKWVSSPQLTLTLSANDAIQMMVEWRKSYQGMFAIWADEAILTFFDPWSVLPEDSPLMEGNQLSFSLSAQNSGFQISIGGYTNNQTTLIEVNPYKLLLEDQAFLSGKGSAQGFELLIRKNTGSLQGWLSYTYSTAIKSMGKQTYKPAFDRTHTLHFVSQSSLGKKWLWQSRFSYLTGTPFTKVVGYYRQHHFNPSVSSQSIGFTEIPVYSTRNAFRLPPYHRLDVSFLRPFVFRGNDMLFHVDIINLYARLNSLYYNRRNEAWIQLPPLISIGIQGELW